VSALDLPRSLREQASSLFRTAQQAGLCQGRSIEAIATASVYAACRLSSVTRPLEELVAVARVDHDRVTNGYRTLNTELALPIPPQSPRTFVPSVASAVNVAPATERHAQEVATAAQDAGLTSGKHPVGFAAACVAIAVAESDESVTQRALAEAADVSARTVREHRDRIQSTLEQ
jgi:transcription initiation factor TFIIB